MVLDSYRGTADRVLLPMARGLARVSPNTLSWVAFAAAVLAAVSFFLGGGTLLMAGAAFVVLNGLFDALDGKVAKLTGTASVRGDFLDHLLDRYADVAILTGIAFSPYSPVWLGLLAIVGVLLSSYMGTQAQAVGLGRQYGGVLGRADRLVILVVAALLQGILDPAEAAAIGVAGAQFTYLGWAMVIFAVLGNVTAIQRAAGIWRRLSPR